MFKPDRPTDVEPTLEELEALSRAETLAALDETDVPDDVKEELLQDLDRRREADVASARGEGVPVVGFEDVEDGGTGEFTSAAPKDSSSAAG